MKSRILLASLFFLTSCTSLQRTTSTDTVLRVPQALQNTNRSSLSSGKNIKLMNDNSPKGFAKSAAAEAPAASDKKLAPQAMQAFPFADTASVRAETYKTVRKFQGTQVPHAKLIPSQAEQQSSKRRSITYGPNKKMVQVLAPSKLQKAAAKSAKLANEKPDVESQVAVPKASEVATGVGPWRPAVYKTAAAKAKPGREMTEDQAKALAKNDSKPAAVAKLKPKVYSYYDDYYESNDYQSSAYSLVADEDTWLYDVDGYGYQYDDDWFKVYVAPGYQNLVLDLRFYHRDGDIDMKLYNSSGSLVASSNSSSDDEYIDVDLTSPGYYYVKIYYGDEGNAYNFKWTTYRYGSLGPDAYEDNDYSSSATRLSSYENMWLSDISGLGTQGDDDWYEIEVERGYQRVIIDNRFYNSEGDIDIALYDPNGYTRLASSTSFSDDEYIDYTISDSYFTTSQYRKFYIKVYGSNRGNSYDMRWYTSTGGAMYVDDGYEPNDYRTSAYPISSGSTGVNATQLDDDWFYFDVTQENQRRIQIQLTSIINRGSIDLYLYNSSGTRVAYSSTSSNNEFIDFTVASTGRYYILVSGQNTATTYNVRWTSMPSGYYEDNYEPNDSRTSPYDLSGREESWLSNVLGYGVNYNDDYYRIRVYPNYQSLNIDLRYNYGEGNMDLELINPRTGVVVASSRSLGNDDFISTVVSEPGDYIVRVFGDNRGSRYDLLWMSFHDQSSVGVGHSGAWFNPATDRQGFFMTDIFREDGSHEFVVAWYTYDTAQPGPGDKKMWIFGQGPVVAGEVNLTLYYSKGGKFMSATPPAQFPVWGTGNFKVTNCTNGTFSFNNTLPDANGRTFSATMPLNRLTPAWVTPDGRNICSGATATPRSNNYPVKYGHSGAWYNTEQDRQGFFVELYPNASGGESLFAGWYTYDPRNPGSQIWYVAQGDYNRADPFVDVVITEINNGEFNKYPVPPTAVNVGTGRFTFNSCTKAAFHFTMPNYVPEAGGGRRSIQDAFYLDKLSPIYKYKGQPLCK